jgi:hypothetical protein
MIGALAKSGRKSLRQSPLGLMVMNHLEELAKLYPQYSPEELVEAKENLEQYLLLAWEIWEAELNAKESTLTEPEASLRIKAKVDSPKN